MEVEIVVAILWCIFIGVVVWMDHDISRGPGRKK